MKPKHKRLVFVICSLLVMGAAATVILRIFNDNLMYFYTPTMLDAKRAEAEFRTDRRFRLGGLVKTGSISHPSHNKTVFTVTDGNAAYTVSYTGLLPTLFREGQGVVLVGLLDEKDRHIRAESILAKHDENYMPPEVADALKKSGYWGGKGGSYAPTESIAP